MFSRVNRILLAITGIFFVICFLPGCSDKTNNTNEIDETDENISVEELEESASNQDACVKTAIDNYHNCRQTCGGCTATNLDAQSQTCCDNCWTTYITAFNACKEEAATPAPTQAHTTLEECYRYCNTSFGGQELLIKQCYEQCDSQYQQTTQETTTPSYEVTSSEQVFTPTFSNMSTKDVQEFNPSNNPAVSPAKKKASTGSYEKTYQYCIAKTKDIFKDKSFYEPLCTNIAITWESLTGVFYVVESSIKNLTY